MSDYSVVESDGFVRVCASLEGELERSITVNISTDDSSALGEQILISSDMYSMFIKYIATKYSII